MSKPTPIPLRPIADLIRDPDNARRHSREQIDSLAAGILEFGFTSPIAANSANVVRAGNARHEAVEAIYAAGGSISWPSGDPIPEGMIPALDCSGWTEAQWAAYALFDNKIAADSTWDERALGRALQELSEMEIDPILSGFGQDEIDAALAGLAEIEGIGFPKLADGDREPFQQMTFTLHDSQVETVKAAIAAAIASGDLDTGINANKNGSGLALICAAYIEAE